MIKSFSQYLLLLFFIYACSSPQPTAQEIVDKSIKFHGGDLYENSIISFDFRDRKYILERDHGLFTYHRIFTDSMGTFHDVLSNSGFKRMLNEKEIEIDSEWAGRYSSSINSVAYFALLPFGLNDPSVNKNLMIEEEIEGNFYYKIRVTFNQEGGGEDFEDEFVYWFHQDSYRMDYFGYYYKEGEGGIRFRKAINSRNVNGTTISDYINFKGAKGDANVGGLAQKYAHGELEKLSEILIKNLEVKRLN